MILCPSCGSNVEGDLRLGCSSCGARAVGPPLAKAEYELPSFGRASFAFASGVAMLATFLGLLIAVLVENKSIRPGFWTIVSAGEAVAWRVKWAAIPIVVAVLIASAKLTRSIKQNPSSHIGLRAARVGLSSAVAVAVLIATLIGITIPVRLERREWGIEAAAYARGHTIHRALLEYRELHGTYPTDPDKYIEALSALPDSDGSIAEALRYVDPAGYQATAQLAAASTKKKPMVPRGTAFRDSTDTALTEPTGVSFTNYELRLPSEHRLFASDEDFILRDGVVMKASDANANPSALSRKP
ncbi:MAG: hypothetical protein DMF72_07270 [Acidobacteria bacterium]|nr:MAG: hypothetical protein DMF72_07270 [Acidobacteriota bacterium]